MNVYLYVCQSWLFIFDIYSKNVLTQLVQIRYLFMFRYCGSDKILSRSEKETSGMSGPTGRLSVTRRMGRKSTWCSWRRSLLQISKSSRSHLDFDFADWRAIFCHRGAAGRVRRKRGQRRLKDLLHDRELHDTFLASRICAASNRFGQRRFRPSAPPRTAWKIPRLKNETISGR